MTSISKMAPVLGAFALSISASALAAPIKFTHTGTGSGTIGGTSFSDAAFTITETTDTSLRLSCGGTCYSIDDTLATIDISGLGSYTFTTGTRTFVNGSIVGFSRAGTFGLDLFNGPANPLLTGYDLLTPIGPVTGTGSLIQWSYGDVNTTGGTLIFTEGFSASTFTATAVPEPSVLGLAAVGLLAVFGLRKKRA